jgi:voltage-gated potassium channel Kch
MARRVPSILKDRKLIALFFIVSFILIAGVTFYHHVEGWKISDAVYFCVITLTTVGYGDITPKTEIGKWFTTGYLLAGVGIVLAFIAVVSNHIIENYRRVTAEYMPSVDKKKKRRTKVLKRRVR